MASLKVHLLKALDNRKGAELAHLKAVRARAELAANRANLDASLAAVAKISNRQNSPTLGGSAK